jgi:hypothetical protein
MGNFLEMAQTWELLAKQRQMERRPQKLWGPHALTQNQPVGLIVIACALCHRGHARGFQNHKPSI